MLACEWGLAGNSFLRHKLLGVIMKRDIAVNDVYAFYCATHNQLRHRRIISIYKGIVCYGNGGDKNGYCKLGSFKRWVKEKKAELINDGNKGLQQNDKADN